MTASRNSDCAAASPDGRYRLSARFQLGRFVYLMRDDRTGRVLWRREQAEDGPGELVVADDAWSIIRTDGFSPEVIALSPAGAEAVRVRILLPPRWAERESGPRAGLGWVAEPMSPTTAGNMWANNSCPCFLQADGRRLFSWRTYWGSRLVLDLEMGRLVESEEQAGLSAAFVAAESAWAIGLLRSFAGRTDEVRRLLARSNRGEGPPVPDDVWRIKAAIALAGTHRLVECAPWLREWEAIDSPSWSTASNALPSFWYEARGFRLVAAHALRLLDLEPVGHAAYRFADEAHDRTLAVPDRPHDRHERAARIDQGTSALEILALLGTPDMITYLPGPREVWHYDHRTPDGWRTLFLAWEEAGRHGRLVSREEAPSPWLSSNEREMEILRI